MKNKFYFIGSMAVINTVVFFTKEFAKYMDVSNPDYCESEVVFSRTLLLV